MKIQEFSQQTGLSAKTIRYYESIGILRSPQRAPNGYREYDDAAISRVKTIQFYLSLGLTADNIAGIIACPAWPQSDRPICKEAYQLYKVKLHEIDEQVNLLHFIRVRLQQRIEAFEQSMESQDSGH